MFAVKREEARPFIEKLADPRIAFWNWRKSYNYGTKNNKAHSGQLPLWALLYLHIR